MAIEGISRAFKDINLSFNAHPVTKDITVLKNENAIKRSVRNIVNTIPRERFFNPTLSIKQENYLNKSETDVELDILLRASPRRLEILKI